MALQCVKMGNLVNREDLFTYSCNPRSKKEMSSSYHDELKGKTRLRKTREAVMPAMIISALIESKIRLWVF